jgi:hypothetical protein
MKKYSKIVFVFLMAMFVFGKNAVASSKGMKPEDAMRHLRNLKGSIAVLSGRIGDKETELQITAKENLEKFSKNPRGRPILEQAFEDTEKESRAHKGKISEKAEEVWWGNFYVLKKTYLGK